MKPRKRSATTAREAQAWWARAAYAGHDRPSALRALDASGIPYRSVLESRNILSAMARGEALIKGAAGLSVPRNRSAKRARYLRLLQWRMVMAYAGFEVFSKACLGKKEKGGLHPEDIDHLASFCRQAVPVLNPPRLTPETAKWIAGGAKGQPIDVVGEFLDMTPGNSAVLQSWIGGTAITTPAGACHIAKILRHATAHGVLSPSKCHGLGLTEAIRATPKIIDYVRRALVVSIYESRPQGACDCPETPRTL